MKSSVATPARPLVALALLSSACTFARAPQGGAAPDCGRDPNQWARVEERLTASYPKTMPLLREAEGTSDPAAVEPAYRRAWDAFLEERKARGGAGDDIPFSRTVAGLGMALHERGRDADALFLLTRGGRFDATRCGPPSRARCETFDRTIRAAFPGLVGSDARPTKST